MDMLVGRDLVGISDGVGYWFICVGFFHQHVLGHGFLLGGIGWDRIGLRDIWHLFDVSFLVYFNVSWPYI